MSPARVSATHNPLRDPRDKRLPRIAGPSSLVLFGVTGDLAKKKLLPAMYDLANRSLLPPAFSLVGFGRRDWDDAHLIDAALDIHGDEPAFGYRFIADDLAAAGHEISERRVWKICSQAQIVSAHARTRGRWKKPGPPVHDDLVERDFTATGPNRLWLTDITEHATAEGKLYLCTVKDVWSRRIVGYSIDDRMPAALAVDALEMAVARRGPGEVTGCVVHADRGSQFRARPYVTALHRAGLVGSMGRVASSADNAAMESGLMHV